MVLEFLTAVLLLYKGICLMLTALSLCGKMKATLPLGVEPKGALVYVKSRRFLEAHPARFLARGLT